jgi:hypothetical protein
MRDALSSAGGSCRNSAVLRDLAAVVAWRSGLPQYRDGAIERWQALPVALRALSLGLAAGQPLAEDTADRLRNPWWNPAAGSEEPPAVPFLAARCGGFRGFGGPFRQPPRAIVLDDRLLASDGEGHWEIHADCFGAALLPVPEPPPGPREGSESAGSTAGSYRIEGSGAVVHGAVQAAFPQLAGCTSWAADRWTLAVTLPDSFFVFLVGAP